MRILNVTETYAPFFEFGGPPVKVRALSEGLARLQNFDIVHIFGLYDLLGPAVAAASRKRGLPYVLEPIGMFVPIVRNLWLKGLYHAVWGKRLLEGASAVIATSEQEAEELVAGGVPRTRVVLRRNGVEVPASWPERGTFRKAQ